MTWQAVPVDEHGVPEGVVVGRRIRLWRPNGSLQVQGACRGWTAHVTPSYLAIVDVEPEMADEYGLADAERVRELLRIRIEEPERLSPDGTVGCLVHTGGRVEVDDG